MLVCQSVSLACDLVPSSYRVAAEPITKAGLITCGPVVLLAMREIRLNEATTVYRSCVHENGKLENRKTWNTTVSRSSSSKEKGTGTSKAELWNDRTAPSSSRQKTELWPKRKQRMNGNRKRHEEKRVTQTTPQREQRLKANRDLQENQSSDAAVRSAIFLIGRLWLWSSRTTGLCLNCSKVGIALSEYSGKVMSQKISEYGF